MKFYLPEIKDESYPDTPGSSSNDTIDPRASLAASSPGDETHTPFIKAESPSTSVTMPTPCQSATGASLDQTRHSAVSVEPGLPDGQPVVGSAHSDSHAPEHHDHVQGAPDNYMDPMANSYGQDYGDGFFESMFNPDIFTNDTSNNANDSTTTAIRPFSDLDNTFLAPELPLSAPSVSDFSAIFSCEGSVPGGC